MSRRRGFVDRLKSTVLPVLVHGVGMVVAIISLWAVEALLKATMGHDAKFFDAIPVAYFVHAGEALVLIRFVWLAFKDFSDE